MPVFLLLFRALFVLQVIACAVPLFGHFGSYQAVNAMMAEMMRWGNGESWISPRVFILKEGAPALHLLYYPFGSAFARFFQILLRLPVEAVPFLGKFAAVLCFQAAGYFIFRIAKRQFSAEAGLWAAWVFLFSPMMMISGASFQNEAFAVFFLMAAMLPLFGKEEKEIFVPGVFFAGLCFGLAVVARIHFAAAGPVFLFLISRQGFRFKSLMSFGTGFLIPVLLWLGWFYHLDATQTSVMTSLFQQSGEGRILKGDIFVNPEFYLRLAKQSLFYWLTPFFLPFLILGLGSKHPARKILITWLLCGFVVAAVLPKKVFDHPFYLLANLPAAALLAGPALHSFFSNKRRLAFFFILAASLFSIRLFWVPAFSTAPQSRDWLAQARVIQQATGIDEVIVIQSAQTAAMQYYARRNGWGLDLNMNQSWVLESNEERHRQMKLKGYGNPRTWVEYLRSQGAETLVITDTDAFRNHSEFYDWVSATFPLKPISDQSVLFYDLRPK